MGRIIELSPNVYNRIAAGEVIENPASAVKEVLENSLDASSTDIKVIIRQAGKKEITIIDNGIGMERDDLYLAIKKHTTSKINNVKDLNRIRTYGFRGEALPSIISVAVVELSSKTENMESGIKLIIENTGNDAKESRVPMNQGTTIKIQNLFYNTPARFKFLKSDKNELLNIKEIVNKLIISNYNVNFELIYDDSKSIIHKAKKDILERIKDIYGHEFCKELIFFEKKTSVFSIYGYMSKPSFNKPNRNYQYLFLNKRPIITNFFHYWITMGYENLLIRKRYPVAFVFVDAPPDFYDVNVHPAKREVRFVNEYLISQNLISSIKNTLNKNLLIPSIKNDKLTKEDGITPEMKKKFIKSIDYSIDKFLEKHRPEKLYKHDPLSSRNKEIAIPLYPEKDFYTAKDYFTFFNTYVLYEDKETDSIYIIDQHAAHERILYERLKRSIEKREDICQSLLIPINLHLSNVEYQIVMDSTKVFKEIGYNIEDFGGNSIIINSIPSCIEYIDDKQLFLDILSDLMANKKIDKNRLKEEILKSMSCKAAIKSGEKLSFPEIEALIKDLLRVEIRYTCPHGRPAIIQLEKNEIEKWFRRK